ncbi:MAG: ABC transporter permease [Actinobacteria bacterium]|nr:ABC transporter permease [Actinomycetota bacterium]
MIWALAWRDVISHKSRTALNALGIVLGVGLIFSVVALSVTLVGSFESLYGSIYGKTDLVISGPNGNGTVKRKMLAKVQAQPGVKVATANVSALLSIVRDGTAGSRQTDQINALGVDPAAPDLSGATILQGRRIRSGDELNIDSDFAERHKLSPGDKLRVATPDGKRRLRVVGITRYGSSIQFGGQGFATIPIAKARKLFQIERDYSEINVRLDKDAQVSIVKPRLRHRLGRRLDIKTPGEKSTDADAQLRAFNVILYFFAAMSLFVGAYLILNSFNMTVAQRLRDIGMLRTVGGTAKQVVRMILLEASVLGAFGALAGLLAGLLLTRVMVEVVQTFSFPIGAVKYPAMAFVIAPLAGFTAAVVGALRPALRAGRIPAIRAVLAEHRAAPLKIGRRMAAAVVMIPLGLAGVFKLASSSVIPPITAFEGIAGIICLLVGVVLIAPAAIPAIVRVLALPLGLASEVDARFSADNTRANPLRTAATASGLMIGVALVAAIGSLGSSLIGSISDQLDKHIKSDFVVQPNDFRQGGIGSKVTISSKTVNQISDLPDVKLATGTKLLYVPRGFRGSDYQAMGFDTAKRARVVNLSYVGQRSRAVLKKVAHGQVTIGGQLKRGRKLKAGQTIKLRGADGVKRVKIAGVVHGSSVEDQAIGMSYKTFREIYGSAAYTQVQVIADSKEARDAVGRRLQRLLRDDHPNLTSLSSAAVKRQVEDQTNQIFSIFYVIMLVAIIVSLLGVANTLLISVLERTREIGVMRAIGSDRSQVRRVITGEGVLLTIAGALLGLAVGLAIGYAFVRGIASDLQGVTFRPPTATILVVALASVLFGLLAAIMPAYRASKMNVIEAIGYE